MMNVRPEEKGLQSIGIRNQSTHSTREQDLLAPSSTRRRRGGARHVSPQHAPDSSLETRAVCTNEQTCFTSSGSQDNQSHAATIRIQQTGMGGV